MKKSYLMLHVAVILAGFTGVFGKLIQVNEVMLVWYRVLFSAAILFFVVKLLQIKKLGSFSEAFKVSKPGLILALHWVFFYASIKYANISIGVVCYCLTSFFTAIFEPLINRKRFNVIQLALSLLTLIGISLIFHFDASYQLGIFLGVISSAFAALYTIYNERLVKHYDSRLMMYYQMVASTALVSLLIPFYYYAFPQQVYVPTTNDIIYLFLLALVCTVGLYVMFAEVLKKISAFTVNLSFNLEPIYAIIMAFLFFKEGQQVNLSFYVGLAFVTSSVVLQTILSIKKKG